MPICCVSGCLNRHSSKRKFKFYRIPTGKAPFQANRRRLWQQAIQQANNNSKELAGSARICGAHFISGEASLDLDNVDFIPTVFKCIKPIPRKKVTGFISRFFGRRGKRRRKVSAVKEQVKTRPDPVETESELSEEWEAPTTRSVAKGRETLTKMAEADKGSKTITSQTTSRPNKTPPSALRPNLGRLNPFVLLTPLVLQAGGYQFQLCRENITTVSQPVEDEELEDEESPRICETCGMQFPNQTTFAQHRCVILEEPSFPCNICTRSFTSSQCLKRHKLLHVKDARKCGKCGVLFCRRHNHIPFQPATTFRDDSSGDELQMAENNVPEHGVEQKSDQIPTYGVDHGAQRTMTLILLTTSVPTPPATTFTGLRSTTTKTTPLTFLTEPTPPATTITVLTSPTTPATVQTPSTATTTTTPTSLTVPKPPMATTTTTSTTVPTPPSTVTVPTPATTTSTPTSLTVPTPTTTTTTTTTTVPTPPNPQPLSNTHKFVHPVPYKKPAPSSALLPPPPVPWRSSNPDTSAELVPHQKPSSSLKIFSPQYLTSALLQVQRNYEFVQCKSKDVMNNIKEEEPSVKPVSPEKKIVKRVQTQSIAYDLEIVV